MKRLCLTIQYNGKNFSGWQIQNNERTVQSVLEKKISSLLKEDINLYASGRTDSGVHAYNQIAHFDTESNFDMKKLAFAINFGLEDDVRVLEAREVASSFHSRYSAKKKTYIYKIYISNILKPLKNGLVVQIKYNLDIKKIKLAMEYFIGTHNFFAFSASGSNVKDFIRTIYDFKLEENNDEFSFVITGSGFLYNMVRIIIGTLIEVGKGNLQPQDISQIIKDKERKNAGQTMPPYGLYLYKVYY
ncbi:MAG: tRNA pseudouridine(38-40) synthase TruA [Clostridia bacterium]|nr:tRNA pseudouridine(38-40) synthase TruA [Clostridia bacterium]MDD4685794.1 tRNA pseudouridine(38-40) synthase TruA [Clostridia bacterium]